MLKKRSELKIGELFANEPLEKLKRRKERPLGKLSNFMVEELPNLLSMVRNKEMDVAVLAARVEELAKSSHVILKQLRGKEKRLLVARLDILMLQAAIYHEEGGIGVELNRLVELVAKLSKRPAGLTYEDVVINNPIADIRTFTNGVIGNSEASFYNGHRYIEQALDPEIDKIKHILKKGKRMNTTSIEAVLTEVIQGMKVNIAYTGTISKKMPDAHFRGTFRKYFSGIDERELIGPSGAFTASVPTLEYLLFGETISKQDIKYQKDHLKYFPLDKQKVLINSLRDARAGKSVRQMLLSRNDSENGLKILTEISELFSSFRKVHLAAVKKHLPEVFGGVEQGTGGTEVQFLVKRGERTHGLK